MSYTLRSTRDGHCVLEGALPNRSLKEVNIHFESRRAGAGIYHCVPGSARASIVVIDDNGKELTVEDVLVEL